jgi:hypothetical protein
MYNSSKAINYRIFKNIISKEKYFLNLPEKYWKLLGKFRTGNARLHVYPWRQEDGETYMNFVIYVTKMK